jgi:hypothetical protein
MWGNEAEQNVHMKLLGACLQVSAGSVLLVVLCIVYVRVCRWYAWHTAVALHTLPLVPPSVSSTQVPTVPPPPPCPNPPMPPPLLSRHVHGGRGRVP